MKKILFVLMAAAMLVSCHEGPEPSDIREVPFRVRHMLTDDIDIILVDSAFRVNDTIWVNSYHKYVVLLERVK